MRSLKIHASSHIRIQWHIYLLTHLCPHQFTHGDNGNRFGYSYISTFTYTCMWVYCEERYVSMCARVRVYMPIKVVLAPETAWRAAKAIDLINSQNSRDYFKNNDWLVNLRLVNTHEERAPNPFVSFLSTPVHQWFSTTFHKSPGERGSHQISGIHAIK